MKLDIATERTPSIDTWIIPCFENGGTAAGIPENVAGEIEKVYNWGDFTGKTGEHYRFHLGKERYLLVGFGEDRPMSPVELRPAAGRAAVAARKITGGTCLFLLPSIELTSRDGVRAFYSALAEGFKLSTYRFEQYKTGNDDKKPDGPDTMLFQVKPGEEEDAGKGLSEGVVIADSVILARDMVMEPSDRHRTHIFRTRLEKMAAESGFSLDVLDMDAIRERGMGGLLAVNRGAQDPPVYAVLQYDGKEDGGKPVVLVGKGVLFDSGGLSLKRSGKFDKMRYDMASAATVAAFIHCAATLKWPVNLVGLLPVTENMIAPDSMKPGEIVRTLAGKTVEIINTDAEGRLLLADALADAARFDPEIILEFSTLSGGIEYVLGDRVTPVLGTADSWKDRLRDAGERSGEPVCFLPLIEELKSKIEGKSADLKNLGGNSAEPITATLFLKEFIGEIPWFHIDIVASAWISETRTLYPAGATGTGVLLLSYLLGPGF